LTSDEQQVLDLIGFICASLGPCSSCGAVTFFNVVAMMGFWVSLVLLALYLFHVIEKLHNVNWLLAVSQEYREDVPSVFGCICENRFSRKYLLPFQQNTGSLSIRE
jgi:hypothetical protein